MRRSICALLVPLLIGCVDATTRGGITPTTQPATRPVKEIQIDMDKAIDLPLPTIQADLQPTAFRTADGRKGWEVRIPGNRPLATPAYASVDGRGMLFVGGGYGSHEFYAFDATSGEKIWQIQTTDDGPTAAVVEDGYVAFNTESCTIIVVEARTGHVVWQEWLGDPLMSQPAISKGKLYMAHPAGQQGHAANGLNQQQAVNAAPPADVRPAKTSHRLLCADLKTGKHLWETDITADVISAPVVDGDKVFLTCFNGTSFCISADTGAVSWKKENAGTSAPVIAEGQIVMTQKRTFNGQSLEGIRRLGPAKGEEKDAVALAESKAEYLNRGAAGNGGIEPALAMKLDASVGFASAPQAAGLAGAAANANVSTVAQAWSFQGSKAAYANGQFLNAQGNAINCLSAADGQPRWRGLAKGRDIGDNAQIFAPPALGKTNMYLCSAQGHLLSVSQEDGKVGFLYATKQPMAFQPALSGGNLYTGTSNGLLICLKTGDPDADGWTAWGGNAQHNKTKEK
jgi:outer membrane protein assembly factor BamB